MGECICRINDILLVKLEFVFERLDYSNLKW